MDILISGHICCLTFFVGLRHLAFNRCGLISADGVCLIPIDLVGLVAAYGIRHITGGVVRDILCFVCDGAFFSGVRDIFRSLLRLRGRARLIRDFRHGRILGIDLMILILRILVLDLEAVLCRSDFRIGLVAVLVSRVIERPFFIMGKLALGGIAVLICYFSPIRNPIRRDGGSTIIFFTG